MLAISGLVILLDKLTISLDSLSAKIYNPRKDIAPINAISNAVRSAVVIGMIISILKRLVGRLLLPSQVGLADQA